MDTRLNKTCSLYTACRYNNILSISVFVIQNDIEFSLYGLLQEKFQLSCIFQCAMYQHKSDSYQ